MIQVIRTDSSNKQFHELIQLLDEGLRITDGDDFSFFAQYNKIDTIKNVVVAFSGKIAVGCGAFKLYENNTVEIKRMYVKPEFRQKGIARNVLAELENWAAEEGFTKCILETGNMLTAAIHLYEQSGYKRIPKYGQYQNVDVSVCMAKNI